MQQKKFWSTLLKADSVLNPVDRISEVLFGLIMVLTFTGAISVATDGRQEIRELLWAALGCNVAWGIVDAIMYIMNVMMERGHGVKVISGLMASQDPKTDRNIIRSEISPVVSSQMTDEDVDRLRLKIRKLPSPEGLVLLTGRDILLALEIFLLVFLCTLPVALPFAFLEDVGTALRTSNGIALVMLFIGGFKLATYAGFRPWLTALVYSIIGVVLVSVTMALGG